MTDILKRIIGDKQNEVQSLKASITAAELAALAKEMPPTRAFAQTLAKAQTKGYGLIAEFKRASPSRGTINANADPESIAQSYEAGGASCLSVLTDAPYFGGHIQDMVAARQATLLPVLRKDFIIDPIQVHESRAHGADCILLILAALDDVAAAELEAAAMEWGMDVLIETHDEQEIDRALKLNSVLIGINNRNLRTMETDPAVGERLLSRIPDGRIAVIESGLKSVDDLSRMARAGGRCFLIGESLMEKSDIAGSTTRLLSNPLPVDWRDRP